MDDALFASQVVQSRVAQRWGLSRIRMDLQKKKVPQSLAEKALSSAFIPGQEETQAQELLERQKRRFSVKKGEAANKARQRAWEFLVRKGYSYSTARLAVEKVLGYNPGLPQEGN